MNMAVQMALSHFKKTFTKENLEELGIGKPIDTNILTDISDKIPGNLKRNIYIPISIYGNEKEFCLADKSNNVVFIGQTNGRTPEKAAGKALKETHIFINFCIAMYRNDKIQIQRISRCDSSKLLSQTKAGYGHLIAAARR
jgi:hypothetical protein